jgi:hypothetical protein
MRVTNDPHVQTEREFNVTGNYGTLYADKATGLVTCYVGDGCDSNDAEGTAGYENIVRFDVDEYRKHYGEVQDTDILLIGFWYTEGGVEKYAEPEHDYRTHHAEDLKWQAA